MTGGIRQRRWNQTRGLLLWLCLFRCSLLWAQPSPTDLRSDVDTGGLVIEATVGWDSTVDHNGPIPISMLINNYGEEAIEGQVVLSDPQRRFEVHLGDLFLGAGASRRFGSIQDLHDWDECYLSVRQGQRVLWRRELILHTGKNFVANLNYLLLVDDGGRKLSLPNAIPEQAASTNQFGVANEQGRPVRSLGVRSWELPEHFGPLTVADAVILPESFPPESLNRRQWSALATWLGQGGTVFVPDNATELLERLLNNAPLPAQATRNEAPFEVQEIGLGAIYRYPPPLLTGSATELRQALGDVVTLLPKNSLYSIVNSIGLHRRKAGQADWNLGIVMTFFFAYAILSGGVALLLFRLNRRQMFVYTVAVVASASVLAGILGLALRSSPGDLRWCSVTQPTADGGFVQVAKLDVRSAGAKSQSVVVKGSHVDAQVTGVGQPNWWRWQERAAFPGYTWQPNQLKQEPDTFHAQVSMTPWGTRRLHAIALAPPTPSRLDWQLNVASASVRTAQSQDASRRYRQDNSNEVLDLPTAQLSITGTNQLPMDLLDCYLVVGVSIASSGSDQVLQQYKSWNQDPPRWAREGTPLDVYAFQHLGNIHANGSLKQDVTLEFRTMENRWDRGWSWAQGSFLPPRLSRFGTASAWIVGRLEQSPVITMDASRSDFVEEEQLHVFLQEIDPAKFQNVERLLNGAITLK